MANKRHGLHPRKPSPPPALLIREDKRHPLLRTLLPVQRRRHRHRLLQTIPLDGTSSLAIYCLAGPSASASLVPKNRTLHVDALTQRINNPCLRITSRRFALLLSQSPRGLGPGPSPSRVASIPLDGNWIRTTRSDMTRLRGPSIPSNTHPHTHPRERSTRPQRIKRRLWGPHIHPLREPFSGTPHPHRASQLTAPPPLEAEPMARAQQAKGNQISGGITPGTTFLFAP